MFCDTTFDISPILPFSQTQPEANVVKLPNVSASIPQLEECIHDDLLLRDLHKRGLIGKIQKANIDDQRDPD